MGVLAMLCLLQCFKSNFNSFYLLNTAHLDINVWKYRPTCLNWCATKKNCNEKYKICVANEWLTVSYLIQEILLWMNIGLWNFISSPELASWRLKVKTSRMWSADQSASANCHGPSWADLRPAVSTAGVQGMGLTLVDICDVLSISNWNKVRSV